MTIARGLTAELIERLGKEPDRKIADEFRLKNDEVRKIRAIYSIAAFQTQKKWSREELKLLGTMSDSEVAKSTGRTRGAVTAARRFYLVKGVDATVENAHWEKIEKAYKGGVLLREISKEYSISSRSILKAAKKYRWKHPEKPSNDMRPEWMTVGCHGDWRDCISKEVRAMWQSFTRAQRQALADQARAQISPRADGVAGE